MSQRPFFNLARTGCICVLALTLNACALFNFGGGGYSKPVTLNAACEQREDDGHYDKINLKIVQNTVQSLDWTSNPRQGKCQFKLADFTQVATQPQADLQSRFDKQCHLYVWQNGQYVTVSTNNCAKVCAVNDYLLPVLLDPNTGACSKIGR